MNKTNLHFCLSIGLTWLIIGEAFGFIVTPKVKLKFESGASIRGSVVADKGKLYFGNSEGFVFCVDKSNAKVNWKFKCSGAITSTPALSGSTILATSRDNFVFAINSASGSLKWKYKMGAVNPHKWGWDYYVASPVISGKSVIIGSGDNSLYSFNIENGSILWQFKTENKIRATPLLSGTLLYVPSFDGNVYVLNSESGKLEWKFETEGAHLNSDDFGWDRNSINSTPVVTDSLMVFGSRDGNVYCVNIKTHKKKWSFTYGPTWAIATPAISDGVVYIGWSDNLLFSAIDLLTGKEKWKYDCGSLVYSTAKIEGESIFVGSANGDLYSFNKSGYVNWEYRLPKSIFSSPVLDNGILYIGCDDGNLYSFEDNPKAFRAVYFPNHLNPRFIETGSIDKGIAPYLTHQGYQLLDSAKLSLFLKDRVKDNIPSVVVFAHEFFPKDLMGDHPAVGLLRTYMEHGGKIVWPGQFPNKAFIFDLLELEIDLRAETGNYFSMATKAGLDWGLPKMFTATNSQIASKNTVPLAINELGRIAAWLRPFGAKKQSGFVFCRTWGRDTVIGDTDLKTLQTIAEYGLD